MKFIQFSPRRSRPRSLLKCNITSSSFNFYTIQLCVRVVGCKMVFAIPKNSCSPLLSQAVPKGQPNKKSIGDSQLVIANWGQKIDNNTLYVERSYLFHFGYGLLASAFGSLSLLFASEFQWRGTTDNDMKTSRWIIHWRWLVNGTNKEIKTDDSIPSTQITWKNYSKSSYLLSKPLSTNLTIQKNRYSSKRFSLKKCSTIKWCHTCFQLVARFVIDSFPLLGNGDNQRKSRVQSGISESHLFGKFSTVVFSFLSTRLKK